MSLLTIGALLLTALLPHASTYDIDPDSVVPIQPLDRLFVVDATTDDYGGCRYIGAARLQNTLEDSHRLARRGMQLVLD